MHLYMNETFFLFLDCLLSSLHKGAIICWFEIFKTIFLRKKAIYDYVLLPAQRYDFISETETPGNVTISKQTKVQIITGCLLNLVASKLSLVGHHHHHILDPVLFPSTDLHGFRLVIVFTTPCHFVRSHASSFTSPFFFISFSTCFFYVCVGLPLLPLTSNFKACQRQVEIASSRQENITIILMRCNKVENTTIVLIRCSNV